MTSRRTLRVPNRTLAASVAEPAAGLAPHEEHTPREAGFTLLELLVSMGLVLVVISGALTAFTHAMRASDTTSLRLALNDQMRIALDLMVRDFIQVGQGLPSTKAITVPNGGATTLILRPSPPGEEYTFPEGTSQLTAVIVGDALGPILEGLPTDIVTLIYADSEFSNVDATVAPGGAMVTVEAATPIVNVRDPIREGDLLMFVNGGSAIQMVSVDPVNQKIRFDAGDAMNLNQQASPAGTILQLDPTPANPNDTFPATMTRIRMISYYLDVQTDPATPRLVRQVNMRDGRVVAFGIENLQFTYDLIDGVTNPSGIASPLVPNQIRKVNITLGARSLDRSRDTRDFFRETMTTQVSFRGLALVDRYL
jgi:prepilin-type N-terminal cleavage/methylation domain-containing protein